MLGDSLTTTEFRKVGARGTHWADVVRVLRNDRRDGVRNT